MEKLVLVLAIKPMNRSQREDTYRTRTIISIYHAVKRVRTVISIIQDSKRLAICPLTKVRSATSSNLLMIC